MDDIKQKLWNSPFDVKLQHKNYETIIKDWLVGLERRNKVKQTRKTKWFSSDLCKFERDYWYMGFIPNIVDFMTEYQS